MKQKLRLTGQNLHISDVLGVIAGSTAISFNNAKEKTYKVVRSYLEAESKQKIIYGVNTGFGPMAGHVLAPKQLRRLQYNLIVSHAVGLGEPVNPVFVRAAMLVRLNTLSRGNSGVSAALLKHLGLLINAGVVPIVPEHGAVGTSGDLVQLAHIAACVIGEGKVWYRGKILDAKSVYKRLRIKPYVLKSKEGLALINGTAFMTGVAVVLADKSNRIMDLALRNAAFALEVTSGYSDSLSPQLHALRPHLGQQLVAARLRKLLSKSSLLKTRVKFHEEYSTGEDEEAKIISELLQDVYSLRCIPQILGPVWETLQSHNKTVEVEMNSVTDNPVIVYQQKKIIHGGNFHGEYIAASVDDLKAALVKLTMLSERRTNYLLSQHVNGRFPPFANLARPGFNLGLQGLQFVATSTTAQSQSLAFPHRVHSIPTNADNQDVVSMGSDAALLADKVAQNSFIVLAIELLTLCQLADHLGIGDLVSDSSKELYKLCRRAVPKILEDRPLGAEIDELVSAIQKIDHAK